MEIRNEKDTRDYRLEFPDMPEDDQNLPTTLIIKDFNNNYLRTDVFIYF